MNNTKSIDILNNVMNIDNEFRNLSKYTLQNQPLINCNLK